MIRARQELFSTYCYSRCSKFYLCRIFNRCYHFPRKNGPPKLTKLLLLQEDSTQAESFFGLSDALLSAFFRDGELRVPKRFKNRQKNFVALVNNHPSKFQRSFTCDNILGHRSQGRKAAKGKYIRQSRMTKLDRSYGKTESLESDDKYRNHND